MSNTLLVCSILTGVAVGAFFVYIFHQARRVVLPAILGILSQYGQGSTTRADIMRQLTIQDDYPLTGVLAIRYALHNGIKKGFMRKSDGLQVVPRYRITDTGRVKAKEYFRKNPLAWGA